LSGLVAVHFGLPDVASLSTAVSRVIGTGRENFRGILNFFVAVRAIHDNQDLAVVFGQPGQMAISSV
jgi:hypothetical protein